MPRFKITHFHTATTYEIVKADKEDDVWEYIAGKAGDVEVIDYDGIARLEGWISSDVEEVTAGKTYGANDGSC